MWFAFRSYGERIYYINTRKKERRENKTRTQIYIYEFLPTDPEVPGSIPGATRFSEK
jgi:hypothetical protein